jgi:hypothetical protein
MLIEILHAISDDDNPRQIVANLVDAVPPGSYPVLSHVASDIDPELEFLEPGARVEEWRASELETRHKSAMWGGVWRKP